MVGCHAAGVHAVGIADAASVSGIGKQLLYLWGHGKDLPKRIYAKLDVRSRDEPRTFVADLMS